MDTKKKVSVIPEESANELDLVLEPNKARGTGGMGGGTCETSGQASVQGEVEEGDPLKLKREQAGCGLRDR